MKKIFPFILFIFIFSISVDAYRIREITWLDSYDQALKQGKNQGKNILLIFTKNKDELLKKIKTAIQNEGFIKNYTTKYFVSCIIEIDKEKELTKKFGVDSTPYIIALTSFGLPFYRVTGILQSDQQFLGFLPRYYSFEKLYYKLNSYKMKNVLFDSYKRLNAERVGKLKKWINKYKHGKTIIAKRKYKAYSKQLSELQKNVRNTADHDKEFSLEDSVSTIIRMNNGRYKIQDFNGNKIYIFERNKNISKESLKPNVKYKFYFYRLNTFGKSIYAYLDYITR